MACKLLLIRHGETVDNVNRIMQGQTPGKLTENGINQARSLGAELSQNTSTPSYRATSNVPSTPVWRWLPPTSKATARQLSPISSRLRC